MMTTDEKYSMNQKNALPYQMAVHFYFHY